MSSGNEASVPCLLCGAPGISPARMKRHIELFHSRSYGDSRNSCYSCIFCEFNTTSESQLQSHINAKHPEQYACPLCELTFSSTCDVETHMAESHAEDMDQKTVLKKFKMDANEEGETDQESSQPSMDVSDEDIKKIDGDSRQVNMDINAENDTEIDQDKGQLETASSASHQTLLATAHPTLSEHVCLDVGAGSYTELSDLELLETSLRLNDCPSEQSAENGEETYMDDFDESIIIFDKSIAEEDALADEESNLLEILEATVKGEHSVEPDTSHRTDTTANHTAIPDLSTNLIADSATDLTTGLATDLAINPTADLATDHPASLTIDPFTDLASDMITDATAHQNKGARPKVRDNKPENLPSAGITKERQSLNFTEKYLDVAGCTNNIVREKRHTVIRAESKPNSTYICPLCTFKTESEGEIQRHFNQEHVLEEGDSENATLGDNPLEQYSCPFCTKGFDTPRDLSQHINSRHPEGEIGGGSSHQPYNWPPVPEGWVQVPLAAEARQKTAENGFECPVCGQVLEDGNEVVRAAHVNEHFQSSLSPTTSQEHHDSEPRSFSKPRQHAPVTYSIDWLLSMKTCRTVLSPFVCHTLQQLGIHGSLACPYGRKKEKQPYGADCDKQAQKDRDHQMALRLQNEEKKHQQEENKRFQSLQAKFGMDTTMTAKQQYEKDLEEAVARGRLTTGEYHEKRIIQMQSSHTGVDDGSTQVAGILEKLQEFYSSRGCPRTVLRAYFSNSTLHFSGSYGDKGWGCGYRNFQMILSCLVNDQRYLQVLFNGKAKIPSVQKIQQLLELAWQKGFDPQGCQQLGNKMVNTRKWIGATEVVAILSSFRVKCQLLDFGKPSGPENTHPVMLNWVRDYYKSSEPFKPPLYLQHQGHSRCIVGAEELSNGSINLILFDPGVPKARMEQFLGNINYNLLQCVRKTINSFRSQQYQIVAVTGILSDREYERSKLIRSTKLS